MNSQRDNVVPLRKEARPPIEPFRPFFVSQMQGRQPRPREWLVDGILLRRTVMLIAGAPKIGKSLLLQQMLTAISLGESFLGRQTVKCRTFGQFCEDSQDELERRQAAINAYYGREPADMELDFSWDARETREAVLVEFERFTDKPQWSPLWDQLVDWVRQNGIQVIGIDTVATAFGGNENFRSQVTAFLRQLQRLASEIDGAIILNAHPSRGNVNSYSGSTGWLASVRAGISLGRPLDWDEDRNGRNDPRRVLRGLGSNYGGGLGLEPIEYADGVFVPTEQEQRAKRGPLSVIEMNELRYRLLIGLKRLIAKGVQVPADEMAKGSLPNRAKRSPDARLNRVALNDLYVAQQDLLEGGQAVLVDVKRRCLIRPADGPFYDNEEPWLPATEPVRAKNAAD